MVCRVIVRDEGSWNMGSNSVFTMLPQLATVAGDVRRGRHAIGAGRAEAGLPERLDKVDALWEDIS